MPRVALRGLHKSFGPSQVIQGVSLDVLAGERHAIIGPNGAGKSTLFHLVSGLLRPDKGSVLLDGKEIVGVRPHTITRMGLARSFQITSIFPSMSVFENLRIGVMRRHGLQLGLWRPVEWYRGIRDEVEQLLGRIRLEDSRDRLSAELNYSEQRALELGMALSTGADVLLLDEPMAGMSREESLHAAALIVEATAGKTLLMVEHDMDVVFSICERISVLVYGKILATGDRDQIRGNAAVQEAYLGKAKP